MGKGRVQILEEIRGRGWDMGEEWFKKWFQRGRRFKEWEQGVRQGVI